MLDSLYLTLGEPFAGVSPGAIVGIAAIYFICFMARGAIGFGALAPAVTFTSWLLPAHHAVLLAVIAATIPQLQLLPESMRGTDWHVAKPVLVAVVMTTAIGAWIFAHMSGDLLTIILGSVISTAVFLDVFKVLDRAVKHIDIRAPAVAFGLAALSGIINGIAGAGGMVALVVYLKHACRDHISLRHTTIFLGTIVLCWRFVLTFLTGMVTVTLLVESALMLPVIYAGVWLGTRFTRDVTAKRYHFMLQSVLLLSALGLVADGLWRVL
jgi:uncharacterized membrane protein YfcA